VTFFRLCLGGGFVNLLACTPTIASKIAAFATVFAALYSVILNSNCPTERAIPIVDFHGTNDSIASYNGGKSHGVTQLSVDNFRKRWVTRNGCQNKPSISHLSRVADPKQLVEIQTWNRSCRAGGIVIGYKINGGQHSWPRTTLPVKCNGKTRRNDCTKESLTISFKRGHRTIS
jgi:polyhydroxybutyrate depolymerase